MSSTNERKDEPVIPPEMMQELEALAQKLSDAPIKTTTPWAAWIRLTCARGGMPMWVIRRGDGKGPIVGVVTTELEGGLMAQALARRGITKITIEAIHKGNIDAIEKEIRRIGGARYLPAEGGVFIGTVAELYGDGK